MENPIIHSTNSSTNPSKKTSDQELQKHGGLIERCIEISLRAVKRGNAPFGALLAIEGTVILEGENTVNSEGWPLGHSELNLLIEASRRFSRDELEKATIYSSAEPCVMCSGAIFNSGIRRVVYGASAQKMSEFFPDDPMIPCRDIFLTSGSEFSVVGPILEQEALQVHLDFWK